MRLFKIPIFFLFIFTSSYCQTSHSDEDVEICNNKFEFAASEKLSKKPIGEVIVEIGKTFLGLDYEAHTLEKGDHEKLIVHLTGLDCYTFFESSLVFARCIKKGKTTFEDFKEELKNIRYRNGEIYKYPSRLHYASDWMYDNAKRGIVTDVTEQIGGIPYVKKIQFMSTHPESYKRLKNNPEYVSEIAEIENKITDRKKYYIPQSKIEKHESKIENGDIILITTGIKGLDISHTGIAVKGADGRIYFMHAPLKGKKIQITEEPLSDYINSIERHTGIMVARPADIQFNNETTQ